MKKRKRVLISVSDKTGIIEFAKKLNCYNFEIISTGGTYSTLLENGINVINISDITKFPEMMDGRVKTLHPNIHGGILAVRDNEKHILEISNMNIETIDMVVCNLYPFKKTIENENNTFEIAIENIDIGGPSMIRSAAKNHKFVTVIVDPNDYDRVIKEIEKGEISNKTKLSFANKAFFHTSLYDSIIANYLNKFVDEEENDKIILAYEKKKTLRYGENPHQKAYFYKDITKKSGSIAFSNQIHGKELSYNNINDADVAISIIKEFEEPVCVAVKHMNPCGVAVGNTVYEAFVKTYEADKISIFGGIIASNREIDEQTAIKMNEIFLEIIIAPSFSKKALDILKTKKNLRLITIDITKNKDENQFVSVSGGLLVQQNDFLNIDEIDINIPTKVKPSEEDIKCAKFAYKVAKFVKSNAIVIAKSSMTIGIGPGQTNRVGAAKIALIQAGDNAKNAVLASDAFFPMSDTVEEAAKYGIKTIIQPGGSIKDNESIEACNKYGIAMIFTGYRHFKH